MIGATLLNAFDIVEIGDRFAIRSPAGLYLRITRDPEDNRPTQLMWVADPTPCAADLEAARVILDDHISGRSRLPGYEFAPFNFE